MDAVQRLVPSACEELLSAAGGRPKKHAVTDIAPLMANPQNYAAGIVDFGGETMNGSLTFLSTFDFFATFGPNGARSTELKRQSAADWVRVRDCAMEMSNQLLGRVKNQFRRVGVGVETKLPRAVSGYALVVTIRERTARPLVYAGAGFDVFVWFEATVGEAASVGPKVDVVAEGDFVEF
ncbi:MAG TPA: hypothetical protein VGM06_05735 [Polyangiaceae bacterium]